MIVSLLLIFGCYSFHFTTKNLLDGWIALYDSDQAWKEYANENYAIKKTCKG